MKTFICPSLVLAASFLVSCAATAQDTKDAPSAQECVRRIQVASASANESPAGLTQDERRDILTGVGSTLYSVAVDCFLWDPDMHTALAAYETEAKPVIRVNPYSEVLDSPTATPDAIVIPGQFPMYMLELGYLAAHDADVRNAVPKPHLSDELGSTPFRRNMIAPLVSLGSFVQGDTFDTMRSQLQCPDGDQVCAQVTTLALFVPAFYLILHENAHQRLHHPDMQNRTTEQELAADASAFAALRILRDKLLESFTPEAAKRARWLFDAFPPLWLKAETESPRSNTQLAARLQAALIFDPSLTRELKSYVTMQHHSANVTTLLPQTSHPVRWYIIDGVGIPPNAIPAAGLIVSGHSHTIVTICSDGIGVSQDTGGTELVFQPFATPATSAKIAQDESDGNYEAVLAETSDADLAPLSADLLWFHIEALHYFKLDSLIPATAANALTGPQQQAVLRWQSGSKPVASWRYSADR